MNIIFILLPLALGFALFFVALFLWANRSDQFEDLESPAQKILLDDHYESPDKRDTFNVTAQLPITKIKPS